MSSDNLPAVPAHVPTLPPSAAAPLCRWIFTRCGWRVAGELPDVAKLVVIAAPHSSNWDVVWGLLVKVGLRLEVRFIGKREAFFWPLGPILKNFGGIPIDRKAAHDVVGEMRRRFETQERSLTKSRPATSGADTVIIGSRPLAAASAASSWTALSCASASASLNLASSNVSCGSVPTEY